jgi:ssDNA-binding Zn-finger/Zn-ribbon topoisomerase 1
MTNNITVITGRSVMTKCADKFIVIKSSRFGDCEICFEPMDLKKNCRTGEEILVCSNNQFCGHKVELKDIKFFNR